MDPEYPCFNRASRKPVGELNGQLGFAVSPSELARVFAFKNVPYTTEAYYSDATGRLRALAADLVEDVSAVDEHRITTEGDRREWGRGRFYRLWRGCQQNPLSKER
jgi:hypothetical protein